MKSAPSSSPPPISSPPTDGAGKSLVLPGLLLGLVVAAALTVSPLWVSLVLAAWFTNLTRSLWGRLARLLGGRQRIAAALVVGSLLLLVLPLLLAGVSLGHDGVAFVRRIATSAENRNRLVQLVSDQPSEGGLPSFDLQSVLNFARQYGSRAWGIMQSIAGKAATGLVGLFMFVFGAYTLLIDGKRFADWAESRSPIAPRHLRRLASAFFETGRGMLVGVGLTGLIQGLVATIAYFALRIPSALGLGILTATASLIPSVGTALIWVPVALGLGLSGRWGAAGILTAVGVLVIGTVDNLLRPVFSRYGQLNLPTFVLFLAIFGGIALYGAAGIILGPLLVRLGVEALEIVRSERMNATDSTAPLVLDPVASSFVERAAPRSAPEPDAD